MQQSLLREHNLHLQREWASLWAGMTVVLLASLTVGLSADGWAVASVDLWAVELVALMDAVLADR